jgi:hypothetical protein
MEAVGGFDFSLCKRNAYLQGAVHFDAGTRAYGLFQKLLGKGVKLRFAIGAVALDFLPPKVSEPSCKLLYVVAGLRELAVYPLVQWPLTQGLVPAGDLHVLLGYEGSASDVSFGAEESFKAWDGISPAPGPVNRWDGIAHVRRWEGADHPAPAAVEHWKGKAQARDFAGPETPVVCFVPVEGVPVTSNPRLGDSYRAKCVKEMKLPVAGEELSEETKKEYAELTEQEIRALADLVWRKAPVFWLEDTPQTTVFGFRHDIVVKGGPISLAFIVRAGECAEWVE